MSSSERKPGVTSGRSCSAGCEKRSVLAAMVLLQVLTTALHLTRLTHPDECSPIVLRQDWGAKPAVDYTVLEHPVEYVIIHHTFKPGHCPEEQDCKNAMRKIQKMHQIDNNWSDFGYNFAIGGDGQIYEGRGFEKMGAHAKGYNARSIGIVFIGDYRTNLPTPRMISAAQSLITCGVRNGTISKHYKLVGHRQVRTTECPGDALFELIRSWSNWHDLWDQQE